MSDEPTRRRVDSLPDDIRAELRAADARMINACDGPNGSVIEFWASPGGLLLVQLHPDGNGFDIFRPFDNTNSAGALIGALRAYLSTDA
jgi:hypothetical protein